MGNCRDAFDGVALAFASKIALGSVLFGCESYPASRGGSDLEVRDSAGVSIIENAGPVWGAAKPWRIEPEPLIQIGRLEGDDPYTFERIGSLGRLSDGRLYLFESGGREIRVYDAEGTFVNAIGRAGDGPGEFPLPAIIDGRAMATMPGDPLVVAIPGDTLLAWTARGSRLTRFLPDGTLVQESVYDPTELRRTLDGLAGATWDLLADGTIFYNADIVGGSARSGPRFQQGELATTTRRVGLLFDDLSRAGPTFDLPFAELFGLANNPAFPRSAVVPEAFPPRLHISTPGSWEVRTYDPDGSLVRITRLPLPRQPLNEEWINARLESMSPRARSETEAALAEFTMPDSVSPIGGLRTDVEGNLWIADAATRSGDIITDIHVVDPAGRWLGRVEGTVAWNNIREIGSDYVLVIWYDDFRVPYVRLHRVLKP